MSGSVPPPDGQDGSRLHEIESCKDVCNEVPTENDKAAAKSSRFLPAFPGRSRTRAKHADEIRSSLPHHRLGRGAEPRRPGAPRRRKRVEVLAVTDHDTLDGLEEVRQTISADQLPLRLVSGVEISHRVGASRDPHRGPRVDEKIPSCRLSGRSAGRREARAEGDRASSGEVPHPRHL